MDLKKAIESAANIITSLLVIGGLLWSVGKPMAQDFIQGTVEDRVHKMEQQMDSIQQQQTASDISQSTIRTQQDEMRKQLEELLKSQRAAGANTDTIEQLLRQLLAEQN